MIQDGGFADSDPDLSRLALKLTEKRFRYDRKTKELQTVSFLSDALESSQLRDVLLRIGRLAPDFTIFSELVSQDSFKTLISSLSPMVIEQLDTCFKPSFLTS